jgi:hypothetical protein
MNARAPEITRHAPSRVRKKETIGLSFAKIAARSMVWWFIEQEPRKLYYAGT